MRDIYAVQEQFVQSGIHSGWAAAFMDLDDSMEVVDPDPHVMFDIVDEATDMLRYYGNIGPSELPPQVETINGFEVGDDRKDESKSPTGLAISLVVQESVFKMITSDQDTFISKDRSNFCEVTTIAPRTKLGNFNYARKNNTTRYLEYVDVMPLRIVIDVSKSNQNDHSSSVPGKASMAGPKMSQSRPDMREHLSLGNLLQDGLLGTGRAKEPKYLPTIQGGSGSPPLFGSALNLYLYMQTFRGGGHARIYGTSTHEIMDLFTQMEVSGTYTSPQLTDRLRMKETYLYGTYKEKVFIPKRSFEDSHKDIGLPPPLYEAGKTTTDIALGESRLVNAKLLVTRSQALVELEKTRRNDIVLFGTISVSGAKREEKLTLTSARRGFDGALSANTALARMLEKRANESDMEKMMKDSFFHYSAAGERDFTLLHAEWITMGAKSNVYSIRDLRRPEDMFIRSEISTEENMKVSGIERLWMRGGKPVITETTTKVGLWKVSSSNYEHAEETLSKLVAIREKTESGTLERAAVMNVFYDQRDNMDDDGLILDKVLKDTGSSAVGTGVLVLISTDNQLARSIAKKSAKKVLRISPSVLVPYVGLEVEEVIKAMDGNVNAFTKFVKFGRNLGLHEKAILGVYVDTGSLQTTLTRYEVGTLSGRKPKKKIMELRIIEIGISEEGHRFEKVGMRPVKASTDDLTLNWPPVKDKDGHFDFTIMKPDSEIRIKVARYDSYMEGDSQSETGTAFSILSGISEGMEDRSDGGFSFDRYLDPAWMD